MGLDADKHKIKQRYEKPRLRTIDLVAAEVLGIGCKMLDPNRLGPYGLNACGLVTTPCELAGT